jgi:hypothetical protein
MPSCQRRGAPDLARACCPAEKFPRTAMNLIKHRFVPALQARDGLSAWMVVLYGALFFLALYLVLSRNVSCLLYGGDGTYWRALFKSQAVRQPFSQLGVSPLEGNFDAYMPSFREYFLPETLALLFGFAAGAPFKYAIYGMEMFISSFALARSVGFSRTVASVAAAFVPVFALPTTLSSIYWLYSIYNLVPHFAQLSSCGIAIIACFWALDVDDRAKAIALSLTALALVMLCFLSSAVAFITVAPCIAVYSGASVFLRKQGATLLAKVGLAVACIAIPAVLGIFQYLIANLGYTAYFFFGREFMQDRVSLDFASIFFQAGFLGRFLVIFGFLGAFFCALTRTGKLRAFAWAHVIITLVFIPASFLVVEFASNYHGPSPLYFEFAQWPIIIIFNAFAASVVWQWLRKALQRFRVRPAYAASRMISAHFALATAPLFLIAWNGWAIAGGHADSCADAGFFPSRPNAITTHLKNAIATQVGKPFRGLVATFASFDGKPSVDWFTLHDEDWRRSLAIGNDMRTYDLWLDSIPTLMQYSPLITPPYYLLVSEFLSRPADKQLRSVLILTHPDRHMLALWGVRFIITDFDPGFGRLELKLPVPGREPLRLYALDDANLGNYSPTAIRPVGNFRQGLVAMHDPEFDGRKGLVTEYPLNGPFVAAEDVRLVFQMAGFTLHASSAGRSILVLPVQYSRCWSVVGQGNPVLFRANMMQLGVMFSGDLDAKLTFRFGPIFASNCRFQDINDMERLDIRDGRPR